MKKIFKFAALAALILPLVVACKKNGQNEPTSPENPNSYETMQDWLDYWSTPNETDEVALTAENMVGIWEIVGKVEETTTGELNTISIPTVNNCKNFEYLHLKPDFAFIRYFFYDKSGGGAEELVTEKEEGTWNVSGKELNFIISNDTSTNTIQLLDKDRLVVTYPIDAWSGNGTKSTCHAIYKRIESLPEMK